MGSFVARGGLWVAAQIGLLIALVYALRLRVDAIPGPAARVAHWGRTVRTRFFRRERRSAWSETPIRRDGLTPMRGSGEFAPDRGSTWRRKALVGDLVVAKVDGSQAPSIMFVLQT